MKVFVSWSKPLSHTVGLAFTEWLPKVIQECRAPYISSNTDKGQAWFQEITEQLQDSKVGVVFITAENLHEEWIHLEAGAIYASLDKRLCPVLVGIKKTDYVGPLSNVQLTEALVKDDMLKLLKTMNVSLDTPLADSTLTASFEAWWPELEAKITQALKETKSEPSKLPRPLEEKVDEILLLVRNASRRTESDDPSEFVRMAKAARVARSEDEARLRAMKLKAFELAHGGLYVSEGVELIGRVVDVDIIPDEDGNEITVAIVKSDKGNALRKIIASNAEYAYSPF